MLKKGKEQRFALRQEQCGRSRLHSFPCSFWSLCVSVSAAVASIVQDSVVNIYIYIYIWTGLITITVEKRSPYVANTHLIAPPNHVFFA